MRFRVRSIDASRREGKRDGDGHHRLQRASRHRHRSRRRSRAVVRDGARATRRVRRGQRHRRHDARRGLLDHRRGRGHLRPARNRLTWEEPVNIDDLILVSVDDHVVEPPDMFEGHIPEKCKDRAPKVITKHDGTDAWVFEGQEATNVGLNAVAGRPPDEYGVEPTRFSEIRPGCFDIHERIRDMNANGVLASMNFPSYPQFCGQYFARAEDKDLALAVLRAYNDWHIDGWCGTYQGRMIPLALPPIWDPQLMADEVRRVAKKGCRAVTFSENPEKLGYPSLHNEYWDPFWQACSDENTVVCLHIGSSSQVVVTSIDAPVDTMITLQPLSIVQAAADLVWSPMLRKFPDLTFALSEGGIGWIPYFLERIDRVYKMHRAWTHQDLGGKLPSE